MENWKWLAVLVISVYMRIIARMKQMCDFAHSPRVLVTAILGFVLCAPFFALADPMGQIDEEPNDLRWDLAAAFEFSVDSIEVSVNSAAVRAISVHISTGFNPLMADGLVIVDVNGPQLCEVVDGDGRAIECRSGQSDVVRRYHESGWYWDREGHAYTDILKPFPVKIQLTGGIEQHVPTSISLLQGYIYAIYADEILKVDVPFDPNQGWIDVEGAPGLSLLVDPRTPPAPEPVEYVSTLPNVPPGFSLDPPRLVPMRPKAALGIYLYMTWVKSATGQRVLGLRDPRYPSSTYAFGDYAVLRTQLYDSQKDRSGLLEQSVTGTVFDGLYGALCSGQLRQGDGNNYDRIRHLILIHPVEVKIPFVVRNISLKMVESL